MAPPTREKLAWALWHWHLRTRTPAGPPHQLQHGCIFRIRALSEHSRILFVNNSKETPIWPLYIEPAAQKVFVSGKQQERLFSPAELKADLDELFQTLEAAHPNLMCFHTERGD